ncbi:hypothetical protein HDU96_004950, partial [Phlyctochytrium bullatum]
RDGLEALKLEINMTDDYEVELLDSELNGFRQEDDEEETDYADRMQTLLDSYALYDIPKKNLADEAERRANLKFEDKVARKFTLGFRPEVRRQMKREFRDMGIHDDFKEIRRHLKSEEKEDLVSRVQRGE